MPRIDVRLTTNDGQEQHITLSELFAIIMNAARFRDKQLADVSEADVIEDTFSVWHP